MDGKVATSPNKTISRVGFAILESIDFPQQYKKKYTVQGRGRACFYHEPIQ